MLRWLQLNWKWVFRFARRWCWHRFWVLSAWFLLLQLVSPKLGKNLSNSWFLRLFFSASFHSSAFSLRNKPNLIHHTQSLLKFWSLERFRTKQEKKELFHLAFSISPLLFFHFRRLLPGHTKFVVPSSKGLFRDKGCCDEQYFLCWLQSCW